MSGSPAELVLRPATAADAGPIARVHVDSWRAAYCGLLPATFLAGLSVRGRAGRWRARLRTIPKREQVLVAEMAGEVVGFASAGPTRDADADAQVVGELYALYVLPAWWSRGVGTRLHSAALTALREAHFSEATLWVLDTNERARRFYERAGWSADGTSKQEVRGTRVTEVRYRRLLSPL